MDSNPIGFKSHRIQNLWIRILSKFLLNTCKILINLFGRLELKWIKKLLGKKESSPAEVVSTELGFEELPSWLEARFRKISSEIEAEASGIFREIETSLADVRESKAELAEAQVSGDFDLRVVKRAKSNRENMMKQVGILLDKVRVPEATDVRTLREFQGMAMQSLDSCVENMSRSFRYTRVVFPQESKEVTDSLARLGQVLKNLQGLLDGQKKELGAIEAAFVNIKEIKDLSASVESEGKGIELKKEKIQALESEITGVGQALEEFRQGETWQSYQNLQKEVSTAEGLLKKAESGLTSLVLPLSNNLSRLKKLHETGRYTLKPEVKQQVEICLADPKAADPAFFRELQKILEDNTLDLKSSKKEKALAQAKAAESGLEARKKEYLEALQIVEEKKKELSGLDTGKLGELGHKEAELRDREGLLKEEIENSEKKLAVLKEELESRKEELGKNVAVIDSSVKLRLTP